MNEVWNRIEQWLKANKPDLLSLLNEGASDSEIDTLETLLSLKLPADVRTSYRRHDGVSNEIGFIEASEVLSLEGVASQWLVWKELLDNGAFDDFQSDPEHGVANDWWNAAWIPITYDGAGNHICLDLAPTSDGHIGQMIEMWHDDRGRTIVAPSFRKWLEQFEGLETGQVAFSDDYSGFVPVEDL